jgi:ABC-type uncharacterized transport system permease subunit
LSLHSINYFFDVQKLFNLRQSHSSVLALVAWVIRVLLRK